MLSYFSPVALCRLLSVASRLVQGAVAIALLGAVGPIKIASADLIGHGGMVRSIDVSKDGQRVITGSFDYTARLWNFGDQAEIAVLDGHDGPVTSAQFLPDGHRALTTSDDGTAILWDISSAEPQELKTLKGHQHKVMASAVDQAGVRALTGGWDGMVILWDLETGDAVRRLESSAAVNTVAFLNDGAWVAGGGHDGKVNIWQVSDGALVGRLEGHALGITSMTASEDGLMLISSSIDRTLRIWDVPSLTEVKVLQHGRGRHSQPYSVSMSPDGKTALSAGKDGRLVQWDLMSGDTIRIIPAHDKIIWAVRFTPDGRFAVTASSDENAKVWHLETGDRIGLQTSAQADHDQLWRSSDHPGAKLFAKCATCHAVTADGPRRSGPHFDGLWGRKVGGLEDYKYSQALLDKDFVWGEQTLFDLFHKGPDVMLPGTKMPIQKVTNEQDLAQLVDFLRVLTEDSATTPAQ